PPKLHRVEVVDFPGLLACYVQLGGKRKTIDNHSPAQVGEIEGFAVVTAEYQIGRLCMQQVGKIGQQFSFSAMGERFQSKAHLSLLEVEHTHGYADDFAKLGMQASIGIHIRSRLVRFKRVAHLMGPQYLEVVI